MLKNISKITLTNYWRNIDKKIFFSFLVLFFIATLEISIPLHFMPFFIKKKVSLPFPQAISKRSEFFFMYLRQNFAKLLSLENEKLL